MRLHRLLSNFRNYTHIKAFNGILKKLEKELARVGAGPIAADIVAAESPKPKSWIRRILSAPGYGDAEEILIITTICHGCPVEIAIPMGKEGIAPPYMISILLPEPIPGRAEYCRGRLGSKWHFEPDDKGRIHDLKRTVPKAKMDQASTSVRVPVTASWDIQVGHSLESAEDGRTEWTINSGYEGGPLTGGYRPQAARYLRAIPAMIAMFDKWKRV